MDNTREEVSAIAEEAAEKALAKFMLVLGIDSTSARSVLEAQAHMTHLRRQYEACQVVQKHSIKTAVGVVVTAIAGYILLAFGLPK